MAKFDPRETLKKIEKRRAAYKKRQAQEAIEGVSPEAIQAIRNLNGANIHQGGGKDFMAMSEDYKAQHGCRLIDAMMAISRKHPEAHEQYIRQANS